MSEEDKTTSLLQKLQSGEMTLEDCQKQLKQSQKTQGDVTYKVASKSGCICFYGLRRMPISIYKEELDTILNTILEQGYNYNEEYSSFIEENEGKLSVKNT